MLRPCALSDRLHRRHDLTVPRVAQNPLAIIARGVTSYAVIVEPEKAGAVCAGLQSHFGGRLRIARAGSHFIDIFQPGVSKGHALRDLAQELCIAAANVIAVPLTAFWVMPLGVAALLLMPFGLDWLALVPMGWGIEGIVIVAHWVAGWPATSRRCWWRSPTWPR